MPLADTNPFAAPSTLPFGLPDFSSITPENTREAAEAGIAEQSKQWKEIAENPEEPTVENTLHALERSGQLLTRTFEAGWTLISSVGGDEWDAVESEFVPRLAALQDELWLNEKLYERLATLEKQREALNLDPETDWLLSEYLRKYRSRGIDLSPADRETLTRLNSEIAALETEFSQRATKAIEAASQLFDDAAPLAGLDAEALGNLSENASARDTSGYLVTFQSWSQQPVLPRLTNPATRAQILEASLARGSGVDPATDTRETLLKLARLRAERAQLLGHKNHASVVANEETARTSDAIAERLRTLAPPAARNVDKEAEALAQLKSESDDSPFAPEDWVFYEEKLRAKLFAVNDEILRPYLELNSVLNNGIFYIAGQLFGITFHERDDLKGYAPEVRVWEVREENGEPLALFLGDYYARKGKNGGAWMHNIVEQSHLLGDLPVVMNNMNITKPAEGEPTLLTWDEVNTCFHEFGHALHGMFSNATYPSLSGANVPRDFVEYPSQCNEMWMKNRHVVANFARHVETGEALPEELLDKLVAMGTFGQGFATTEYLAAAVVDQAWHSLTPDEVPTDPDDVASFEENALREAGLAHEMVPPRYRSTYFNHAFGGGYDASYYSYIWAEVLDADTAEWFTTEAAIGDDGGLNRAAGQRYRDEILSRGNTRDPLESFRRFRGRDADITALLKKRDLLDETV